MADQKTPEQQQKEMEQTRKDNEERAKKQQEEQRKQQEEQKKREEERNKQSQSKPGQGQRTAGGTTGKVSTYSAKQGEAVPGQDPRGEDRRPSVDEIKEMAGDLMPGELGWVDLDEEGQPQGAAKRDIPDQDEVVARVFVSPKAAWEDLVTPSGAPITRFMNPEPSLWDEGMRLRNPVPKEDRQKGSQYRQTAGGGVINQPVTV